jgi:WD40 repeat protein
MEGHSYEVLALAVSRDGQMIASSDEGGELIVWHGETGDRESLTKLEANDSSYWYSSMDFSADGTVLATDAVTFWCTKTWQMQGDPINCDRAAFDIRHLVNFLPSQHPSISKFIIQAQGNTSHLGRFTQHTTCHSRGHPMAHAFLQGAVMATYKSGIH